MPEFDTSLSFGYMALSIMLVVFLPLVFYFVLLLLLRGLGAVTRG